jgi:hypothetical protein
MLGDELRPVDFLDWSASQATLGRNQISAGQDSSCQAKQPFAFLFPENKNNSDE